MINKEKEKREQLKTETRRRTSSTGNLDDYIKRRRPEETDETVTNPEVFKRSKIIIRTQTKGNTDIEAENKEMEEVRNFLKTMSQDIKEMRQENAEVKQEIRETTRKMQEQIEMQAKELGALERELRETKVSWEQEKKLGEERIKQLEQKLGAVEYNFELQERQKRKNRVVVTGMIIEKNERRPLKDSIGNFLKNNLEVDVKIATAYKMGNEKSVVEMEGFEEKMVVMRNKYKLMKLPGSKIYIDDDLTHMERGIQATIRKQAEELRKLGRKVKVGYQKLICEGKMLKWNQEVGELQEVKDSPPAPLSKN